jgi:hypothetical protein
LNERVVPRPGISEISPSGRRRQSNDEDLSKRNDICSKLVPARQRAVNKTIRDHVNSAVGYKLDQRSVNRISWKPGR